MSTSKNSSCGGVYKRSKNPNFYLSVFSSIKAGLNPSQICSRLNISKQLLSYYLEVLKLHGNIKKVGYGTWEAVKEVKILHVEHSKFESKIRSHAFGFYLKIPIIKEWSKREEFLNSKNINFKPSELINIKSQKFIYRNFHITLFSHGIKFLSVKEKNEFRTNSATLGKEMAIRRIIEVIRGLESLFGVSFVINKQYQVRVTRQHHANVRNELAKFYNDSHRKLKVFNEKGYWLLIDCSLNVDELESVRGGTADSDMDNVVMPFFNSTKKHFESTGETWTLENFDKLADITKDTAKNQAEFGKNLIAHTEAIQTISQTQRIEVEVLKELKNTINEFRQEIAKKKKWWKLF